MRVLVAEQHAAVREQLARVIASLGHDVVVATTPEDVRERMGGKHPPAIALINANARGGALWEAVGRTQSDRPSLSHGGPAELPAACYVLAIVEPSNLADVGSLLDNGADDYLGKPFRDDDVAARVRAAARIVDLRCEVAMAREWIEVESSRDPVTGLLNREAVFDVLDRELVRAARESRPFAFAVVHLDQFAKEAPRLAEGATDVVLHEVGRRLRDAVRPYDALARYSEDEFALVLPGVDERSAAIVGERLRQCLGTPVPLERSFLSLTGSVGIVTVDGPVGVDAAAVVNAADASCLRASQSGGDRVDVSDSHGRPSMGNEVRSAAILSMRIARSEPS